MLLCPKLMPLSSFLTGFALLAASALPQSTTVKPTATPAPTTTFHSDALHLDYTYPSSIATIQGIAESAIKEEKDSATGVVKAAVGCVTLPLTAVESNNGLRMAMIMRMDETCLGTTTSANQLNFVTSSALGGSLKRFGEPVMGTPTSYQIAAHDAATVSGVVQSEKYGATFYAIASCIIQGNNVVCWELITSDCSKLPEMMAYPVKFEGAPAEALIPAKFAPTCKP